MAEEEPTVGDQFWRFLAIERDVLVLSLAMFAFSPGVQMTSSYLPVHERPRRLGVRDRAVRDGRQRDLGGVLLPRRRRLGPTGLAVRAHGVRPALDWGSRS